MTTSVNSLSEAVARAAEAYGNALNTWYPQHGNNAPAERNLTLQLAFALKEIVPTAQFYAESSLGPSAKRRVDLVAYDPGARALVVVEAKRFLEKSPGEILDDVQRIGEFKPENDNRDIPFDAKFGVILTQTVEDKNADWWCGAGQRTSDGPAWAALESHLVNVAATGGVRDAKRVYSWKDGGVTRHRHVLSCIWQF